MEQWKDQRSESNVKNKGITKEQRKDQEQWEIKKNTNVKIFETIVEKFA